MQNGFDHEMSKFTYYEAGGSKMLSFTNFFLSKSALSIHPGVPNTINFHLYIFKFLHDLSMLPKNSCHDLVPNPSIYIHIHIYIYNRDKNRNSCWKKGRDLQMKDTNKHTDMFRHSQRSRRGAIFIVCSYTFILFWLR